MSAPVEEPVQVPPRRGWAIDTTPLRNRHFRRLFWGVAATMLGQQMTLVAVPFQVYALTGSSLLVGVTSIVALVPLVVFGLLGGAASDGLWDPRPRGSQLAAVASVQSTVVDSHEELAERVRLLDEETSPGPVPRPAIWGGYRVVPERVEFWQGGADRLHDRIRFVRDDAEGGGWIVQRLAP